MNGLNRQGFYKSVATQMIRVQVIAKIRIEEA